MTIYNSITETIGNTPVVRIAKGVPEGVNLFAKVEAFNPMGSVKDRLALSIIERAEQSGQLQPGQTVVEATSGNTGVGLAMVCAQKGYPLVVTMAENFSLERRKLLRMLGARVVLTPAAEKGTGMAKKAEELSRKHGYYYCRQFENPANWQVHEQQTGGEIVADFIDCPLDYWVSVYGTGGTVAGVARRLKTDSPQTKIVVAEPDNAQMLGSGIPQPVHDDGTPSVSHPLFRPHLLQGAAPDFLSGIIRQAVASQLIDQVVPVKGEAVLRGARMLASQQGILAGTSSGATFIAALDIAKQAPAGTNILCMLPDTGERYLSTPLFDHLVDEMCEAELLLSESTPACRFIATGGSPAHSKPEKEPEDDVLAAHEVRIAAQPVVMYALEWCEFCWSARKFFDTAGIPYQSVDLDSVDFQKDNLGGRIRTVLHARTGQPTIPQIYIGGQHVGGCSELFTEYSQGNLAMMLAGAGITGIQEGLNPQQFLPGWQQPRLESQS